MILHKAIDSNQNSYFAFLIIKDSLEMERIRSCPSRFCNKTHKVWLMPYSNENWHIINPDSPKDFLAKGNGTK